MPRPPPTLMDEIVEEVLLRFPPQERASLVRAAVVSKQWCRLISGPGFRRRFREFHRRPPMLGFLRSDVNRYEGPTLFMPTTAFCPRHTDRGHCVALDARHGRVLLWLPNEKVLMVWDPITDEQKELPIPVQRKLSWAGAILCSAAAAGVTCDHLDCHRGPFVVVYVASYLWTTVVYTYSSDVDAWSQIISGAPKNGRFLADLQCTVLVGNALYFGGQMTDLILKYNVESREMSWAQTPNGCSLQRYRYALTTMEEGRLGLVTVIGSKLCVWLRKDGHEVDAGWAQTRVIELKTLLPFGDATQPRVVGFADGLGIVFLKLNNLLYTIDLKTSNVKKLCQTRGFYTIIVPYMSFYTPALEAACSSEETSAGGSSA